MRCSGCGTTKVRDRIELRQESASEGEMGSKMGIEWDGGDGRMVWVGWSMDWIPDCQGQEGASG